MTSETGSSSDSESTTGVDLDCDTTLAGSESEGPEVVGEWSAPVDWSLSAIENNIACDEAPCEVGPGFLGTHAIHLPTKEVLFWDGLSAGMPPQPNQYLWSINTGTFEYVPVDYERKGCAFDNRVDCVSDNDCSYYCATWSNSNCPIDFSCDIASCALDTGVSCSTRDDCVAYCQGPGLEEPECQYDSKDITCEVSSAVHDLFCAGHVHGAEGRPVLGGGNISGDFGWGGLLSLIGFDPSTKEWSYIASTGQFRWYPSLAYLGDDSLMIMGGEFTLNNVQFLTVANSEIYTSNSTWPADLLSVAQNQATEKIQYPFLFTLDHGVVFYAGAEGHRSPYHHGYFFQSPGYDLPVGWLSSNVDSQIPGGSAVQYVPRKIMKSGGCTSKGDRCPATAQAETVDLNSVFGEPSLLPSSWAATCPMRHPRHFHNLTLLPDGTVLATGGNTEGNGSPTTFCEGGISRFACSSMTDCGISRCDDANGWKKSDYTTCINPSDCADGVDCLTPGGTCDPYNNEHFATKSAELWDPSTGRWTELAAQQHPRMYHSVAFLLPDGRVLSAGGGKRGSTLNNQYSAEYFSPPYLFKGPRPVIEEAPEAISHGAMFEVDLEPESVAATEIARFTLLRLASVTHGFDMEQRFMELEFLPIGPPARYRVIAPPTSGLAPPGWYLLFALNSDGVPSVGEYIRIERP